MQNSQTHNHETCDMNPNFEMLHQLSSKHLIEFSLEHFLDAVTFAVGAYMYLVHMDVHSWFDGFQNASRNGT